MRMPAMLRTIAPPLLILIVAATAGCSRAGGVDIWEAIASDNAAAIAKYAEAGGDLDIKGWGGGTALWEALQQEKPNSYEALLKHGASPNVLMRGKRVITHWAAMKEDPRWLRLALEHGADPNLVNTGRGRPLEGHPLRFAISNGTLETVKLLVEHGADINKPFIYDSYPLASAGAQTKFDIVLYFLDQGADYKIAKCQGIPFLDQFRVHYENKEEWFILKEDRDKIDEIHSWFETRGIDIGAG